MRRGAILTFWIWGAILFAPLAIVFGVLGRNEARKTPKDGEGMGTAGMVLGIVAIVFTIPWAVSWRRSRRARLAWAPCTSRSSGAIR